MTCSIDPSHFNLNTLSQMPLSAGTAPLRLMEMYQFTSPELSGTHFFQDFKEKSVRKMVGLCYSWLRFFPPLFFFPAFPALFMILHLPPVELAGSLRCTPNSGKEATPFLYSTTVRASLLDHFYFLFCSNYTKIWETRDTTGGDENPQSSVSPFPPCI